MPAVRVGWPLAEDTGRDADFLRGNMNLLAAKIGTLQAKLVSIDGLGQRVAKVAGVAYTDPELAKQLASAQPSVSTQPEASGVMDELFTDQTPPTAASAEELGRQLDDIQVRLAQQSDNLKLLDAALTQRSADQARMPTAMPITDYPYLSSSYGWRRNPVTGRSALHEGLDFSAPPGTPILAASGGVVLESKFHPGYGNMVEIDHGDGLITATRTPRRCWSSRGSWSIAASRSLASAAPAVPPVRTCTSRCGWPASRWIRACSWGRSRTLRRPWPARPARTAPRADPAAGCKRDGLIIVPGYYAAGALNWFVSRRTPLNQ